MCRPASLLLVVLTLFTVTALPRQIWAAPDSTDTLRPLADPDFERQFHQWRQSSDESSRLPRARDLFFRQGLSSAQVRRLAQSIEDEDNRVEFVVSAYHCTVDPENYYDVYDAFRTFSKVFRMHDRLSALRRAPAGPVVLPGPQPLTGEEFAEIVASLRHESFDTGRLSLLKVIHRKAQNRISSAQLAELLDLFSFENQRLVGAKLALTWVRDPENLYLLYPKFTFGNNKDQLTQAIAARNGPGRDRPR